LREELAGLEAAILRLKRLPSPARKRRWAVLCLLPVRLRPLLLLHFHKKAYCCQGSSEVPFERAASRHRQAARAVYLTVANSGAPSGPEKSFGGLPRMYLHPESRRLLRAACLVSHYQKISRARQGSCVRLRVCGHTSGPVGHNSGLKMINQPTTFLTTRNDPISYTGVRGRGEFQHTAGRSFAGIYRQYSAALLGDRVAGYGLGVFPGGSAVGGACYLRGTVAAGF
jgi:hypothetical protein